MFLKYEIIGEKISPPLLFIAAQVKYQLGQYAASKEKLDQYFSVSNSESTNYGKALAMYKNVIPKAALQQDEYLREAPLRKKRLADLVFNQKKSAAMDRINSELGGIDKLSSLLPEMVLIPSGTFMMGEKNKGKVHADKKPKHKVSIKEFRLASTETTQKLWSIIMGEIQWPDIFIVGEHKNAPVRGENLPVLTATWEDTQSFLAILNDLTDRTFRLPSESEWEYSSRAGKRTRFSWGNKPDKRYIHYYSDPSPFMKPLSAHEVSPNSFGLYHMFGNALEWTQDCYHRDYNGAPTDGTAREVCSSKYHVARGGSFFIDFDFMYRHKIFLPRFRPSEKGKLEAGFAGFRLAESI